MNFEEVEIKNYTNRIAKELFELSFDTLVIEDLKNLKQNKHGKSWHGSRRSL